MAETNYVPFLDSCTYVYYDQPIYPAYNHRAFLKALRSCGYSNKGVTASDGGGWATFQVKSSSGSWISSGGRLVFNSQDTNLQVRVSAISPYLDDEFAPISNIIIYACCGDATHSPKIPCGIEGPYEDNTWKAIQVIDPINMTGSYLNEQTVATISKDKFAFYDYIRVEVQFKKSKLLKDIISTAYCNPVLIHNPAAEIK